MGLQSISRNRGETSQIRLVEDSGCTFTFLDIKSVVKHNDNTNPTILSDALAGGVKT
jgi:hypothetical protein